MLHHNLGTAGLVGRRATTWKQDERKVDAAMGPPEPLESLTIVDKRGPPDGLAVLPAKRAGPSRAPAFRFA